jgi:hypothetical protein
MQTIHLYFDGGTVHGSFKVFVDFVDESQLVYHQQYDMDGVGDSNQAEFTVLLRALRRLLMLYDNPQDFFVKIYGDNSLVPKMIGRKTSGLWNGELSSVETFTYLTGVIREKLDRFGGFEYNKVKRATIVHMLGH